MTDYVGQLMGYGDFRLEWYDNDGDIRYYDFWTAKASFHTTLKDVVEELQEAGDLNEGDEWKVVELKK